MKSLINFNNHWGDTESIKRLETSDKGPEVCKAQVENYLKEMTLRFERSLNQSTLQLWASDLVDLGYKPHQLKEVCRQVPYRFEKHPTLSQLLDLLKPYLSKKEVLTDELTDLSNRCFDHLKAKFLAVGTQEILTLMTKSYSIHVFPFCEHFTEKNKEMLVLNDWLRSYFKTNPQAILDQGKLSNEAFERRDREYFINPLKSYAKQNNL